MLSKFVATALLAAAVAATAIGAPRVAGAAADNAFTSDMDVVHKLLFEHDKIKRTVTNLPNGVRTVTESSDPQVTRYIKEHVASMNQRLRDGRVFNIASPTLPAIFQSASKIHTQIEQTPDGVIFTQTSDDPAIVAALQTHAGEVSDLAREGIVALHRTMMANRNPTMMEHMRDMMMQGGPMGDMHGR